MTQARARLGKLLSEIIPGMSAISQAFVKDLMKSPQWAGLMGNLGKGANFDGAFAQAFRGQPVQVLTQWLSRR